MLALGKDSFKTVLSQPNLRNLGLITLPEKIVTSILPRLDVTDVELNKSALPIRFGALFLASGIRDSLNYLHNASLKQDRNLLAKEKGISIFPEHYS